MNNHSTKLPKLPHLRPLGTPQQAKSRLISNLLIGGGLLLLLLSGWQAYQYQQILSPPPPAPIVQASEMLPELPTMGQANLDLAAQVRATLVAHEMAVQARATLLARAPTFVETEVQIAVQPTPTAAWRTVQQATTIAPILPTPTLSPEVLMLQSIVSEVIQEIDFSEAAQPNRVVAQVATPTPAPAAPISRIVAESINLDATVIEVGWQSWVDEQGNQRSLWEVADYAAGWHRNSARPGEGENIVISAHHNIKGQIFRYTINLEVGDVVTLYEQGQPHSYTVTDKFIVKEVGEPLSVRRANARWIGPFGEERLTMVTCWPFSSNTHRAIVIAKPTVTE